MKEMVLVSGGAGYIGSHTAVELINAGYSEEDVAKFIELSVNKPERAEREAKRLFKMYANIRDGK